jgi:hypothetical protein
MEFKSLQAGWHEPTGRAHEARSSKTCLTVRLGRSQRCNRIPGSSSAAVPLTVPFTASLIGAPADNHGQHSSSIDRAASDFWT